MSLSRDLNMCQGTGRKGKEKSFILYDISNTPIIRHIKVKVQSSPDDPLLKEYWQKRQIKKREKLQSPRF